MTRACCDSQAGRTLYRRSSPGGIIALLSLALRPLTGIASVRRRSATPRLQRPLTRSRQRYLKSAPAHTNPDDDAVPKSP